MLGTPAFTLAGAIPWQCFQGSAVAGQDPHAGGTSRGLFGAQVKIATLEGSAMSRGHVWVGSSPPTSGLWAAEPSPYLPPPGWRSGKGRTVRCHRVSPEPHSTQAWTPGKQDF